MSVKVTWRGDELKQKIHAAEKATLEETARLTVARAKASHPGWKNVTGEAEASIAAEDVQTVSGKRRILIGSRLPRFQFLEVGRRGRAGDHTIRRAVDVEGSHLRERLATRVKAF